MHDTGGMTKARSTRSRNLLRVLGYLVAVLLIGTAGFYLLLVQPGKGGILARATAGDGTELLVTQSWNGWDNGGEPYTVSFYSREPGGTWLWQYLDHEARRWPDCRLEFVAGSRSVRVSSAGELKQTIDLDAPHKTERTPPYLEQGS